MRNKAIAVFIMSIFLLLALGLFNLQVIHGRKFKELSNKNCIRLLTQAGGRGRILDRNGRVIIGNRLSYDVLVLPQDDKQVEAALRKLSVVLPADYGRLKESFDGGYISSSMPVNVVRNIDAKKAIILEESKLNFPAIVIQPHPVRDYPYNRLACHVIGYLNEIDHWRLTKLGDYGYKTKDIVGFGGIEEKYDYYLRQEDGVLSVEVDHRGNFMRVLGFKPSRNGKDVQLTLDLQVQKIAEDVLGDRKGSVIIMDPATGEIIAMVSNPGFAPAAFIKKSGSYIPGLFNSPQAPLLNRAISGVYPPGSVFKVVVASAALETGKINPDTTFTCTGSTYVGRREFRCWDKHGQQNLLAAIAHSCDVFFYKTGLLLGAQNIHDYALKFGFSKPTSIDLPYESGGFVPSPLWRKLSRFQNWYDGDTANFAIGQGDLMVTPIQVTRAMAVFANKGVLVRPYLAKAVDNHDISSSQRKFTKAGLKVSTINSVSQGLRQVVAEPSGTGSILAGLPVEVAGKTGTVQVPRGQAHAWFAGFFPYKKPKFVICVFLEHGASGQVSCRLARQIIEMMAKENLI
ncbi:MAG: penicillin-binding protein 2 [Candidatus Omnitrophica bacterium]|nr:penicillin-binding protein 2 [Candidatus Omnitrophota bacterium]